MAELKRLLVISHTPHYQQNGQIVGWGPTVQEIDYLARAFGPVVHLAPLYSDSAPVSSLPYTSGQVRLQPLPVAGGPGITNKLEILRVFPIYARAIRQALGEADVVQVRCPCNIGLVACPLVGRDKRVIRWGKYAGNWRAIQGQPWSYRVQRGFLAQGWLNGPVTINGAWPGQPAHVHSFYNPSLTGQEVQEAAAITASKTLSNPIQLLFVGRTERAKGLGLVIQMVAQLKQKGYAVWLDIIGDGPERSRFEVLVNELAVEDNVQFHGWLARPQLKPFYIKAHMLLLPSYSEGWPKVLSEGMAFGVVPIASAVSSIPETLRETGAGLSFPPLEINAFVSAVEMLIQNPEMWQEMANKGRAAAPAFTFETYVQRLGHILNLPVAL